MADDDARTDPELHRPDEAAPSRRRPDENPGHSEDTDDTTVFPATAPTTAFPQQQYPPQQHGYPPQQPGYPPQQPPPQQSYPPQHGQFTGGFNPHSGQPGSGPYPAYGRTDGFGPQQAAPGAMAMTSRVTSQVAAMPWQEKVMRLPGILGMLAALLLLISTVTNWWEFGMRAEGTVFGLAISPFRGVSGTSGSSFTDAAMLNDFTSEEISGIEQFGLVVGVLLVVAAVVLAAAGTLVAMGRSAVLGPALLVLGVLLVVQARLTSAMLDNASDLLGSAGGILGGATDDFAGALMEGLGLSFVIDPGAGVWLSAVAMWLVWIGVLIYFGMIIYREVVRVRRWRP